MLPRAVRIVTIQITQCTDEILEDFASMSLDLVLVHGDIVCDDIVLHDSPSAIRTVPTSQIRDDAGDSKPF